MRKTALLTVGFIIVASIIGLWYILAPAPEKTVPVTIAYAPFESTALIWIAEDKGFFSRHNLEISFRKYDTGAKALDATLNAEADIAVGTAEYPVVVRVLLKKTPSIVGTIDKGDFIYLVGRKDRGIQSVLDLKGKKVGIAIGTVAQFHLGRYLNLHGMDYDDITLVDLKTPEEWINEVAVGTVDAGVTAQPYADMAKKRLGGNGVVWPVQSQQPVFGLLAADRTWTAKHPDLVIRFLAALAEAEEFLNDHPAESKAIVRNRLNLDASYMDSVWKQNRYGLSLDQSLVLAMEDEARWMIANGLTTEKAIPDFLDYVAESGINKVKPDAVNVIRAR